MHARAAIVNADRSLIAALSIRAVQHAIALALDANALDLGSELGHKIHSEAEAIIDRLTRRRADRGSPLVI